MLRKSVLFAFAMCLAGMLTLPAFAQDPVPTPGVEIADGATGEVAVSPGTPVPTIKPGEEVDWAIATFQAAKAAADQKAWGPFASVILMALLSLFSASVLRFKGLREKLKPYMGEVALATGVLGYIGIAVGALPPGAALSDWGGAVWSGVEIGCAAVGAYELLAKRVLKVYLPKLWAWVSKIWAKKDPE
jgi:hypothetical protein